MGGGALLTRVQEEARAGVGGVPLRVFPLADEAAPSLPRRGILVDLPDPLRWWREESLGRREALEVAR